MPHWGIFPLHCFLTVWRSGPPFIHDLRHSELSCHTFSSAFKATSLVLVVQSCILSFGVQSHQRVFSLAFRAIITFQFQCSEPSSVFRSTFKVASSVPTFRVVITSPLWCSEPSLCFQFGVQSHHRFSDRHSELHPWFRRSESLSLLSLTFRVIIITF